MNFLPLYKLTVLIFLFLIINIESLHAQKSLSQASSFSHLVDVNKQWLKYEELSPQILTSFDTENDRISFHLQQVILNLKTNTPQQFSIKAKTNRLALLDKLSDYANRKEFPTNNFHSKRTPYFVDSKGVHCAVGYLMAVSGNNDLVKQISLNHNYDYIEDIKTDGVLAWATDNGFTIDELKWIQPTYGLAYRYKPLLNGANGSITNSERINYFDKMAYAGKFDSLDLKPCLNIGYYDGENLSCFGNGIKGQINDITFYEELFAGGLLEYNNSIFSLARFKNNTWNYFNIPNRIGNEITAMDAYWLNGLNISIKTNTKNSEIWNFKNDVWNKIATVNGIVLDLKNTELGYVYAGHFDTVIVNNQGSINLDDTIVTHNAVMKNTSTNDWYSFDNQVSDTIFDIASTQNSILFAGNCTNANEICLSKFLNNDLQPLILLSHFKDSTYSVIKDIEFNGGKLYLGGKFNVQDPMGESGSNYAIFNFVNNLTSPLSTLNNTVNTISFYNGINILGGEFSRDGHNPNISFLAQFDKYKQPGSPIEIDSIIIIKDTVKEKEIIDIKISPNPFTNQIEIINGGEKEFNYFIYNNSGYLINSGKTKYHTISKLNHFSSGVYILKLQNKLTEHVQKIVKK